MKIKRALIDFSQICFAQFYGGVVKDTDLETLEDKIAFFKHRVFTKLADIQKHIKCHETILAIDSNSWRYDAFKFYKAKRKEDRVEKSVEFDILFKCIDAVKVDLKDFNYKIIELSGAEGDDIIAILTKKFQKDENTEEIFIVSTDKDFQQLTDNRTHLFNHIKNEKITCENKDVFTLKLVMGGDASDGIPNMLSDDDTFVNSEKRQKACGDVKMNKILADGLDNFFKNDIIAKKNFDRNKKLILLTEEFIPENIWKGVEDKYNEISSNFKRKNAIQIANTFRCLSLNSLVSKANDFI